MVWIKFYLHAPCCAILGKFLYLPESQVLHHRIETITTEAKMYWALRCCRSLWTLEGRSSHAASLPNYSPGSNSVSSQLQIVLNGLHGIFISEPSFDFFSIVQWDRPSRADDTHFEMKKWCSESLSGFSEVIQLANEGDGSEGRS